MKPQERRRIMLLIIIAIIVIILLINLKNQKTNISLENNTDSNAKQTVTELENGVKQNISEKLAEKKYFANFEVSNIQLIEKEGETYLSANITNTTETKVEMTTLEITFYDKEGNEITTIKDALIAEIEPEDSTKLNVSTSSKCVQAYDFSIKISEEGGN